MSVFKGVTPLFLFILALPVTAQAPSNMSEEQMRQMMQGMNQMANCFKSIDQGKLEAMAAEAEKKQQEIKQLCAAGEREEAQQEAVAFGLKYTSSEEFKQLKKCGEMAQGMMPETLDYSAYIDEKSEEYNNRHVCDDI